MTYKRLGTNIWINEHINMGRDVSVGHASCIGYGQDASLTTRIGNRVTIGAFCVIEQGVEIEEDVIIDHYCRISNGTLVGTRTRILYGVQIFEDVLIGTDCIIGGNLADRTIIEDNVTFMGEIAHSYRDASLDWETTIEPSPIVRNGSVIGVNALLIGGVSIGPRSYIAAGEIVHHDIPPNMVLYKGKLSPLAEWRGLLKVRD